MFLYKQTNGKLKGKPSKPGDVSEQLLMLCSDYFYLCDCRREQCSRHLRLEEARRALLNREAHSLHPLQWVAIATVIWLLLLYWQGLHLCVVKFFHEILCSLRWREKRRRVPLHQQAQVERWANEIRGQNNLGWVIAKKKFWKDPIFYNFVCLAN